VISHCIKSNFDIAIFVNFVYRYLKLFLYAANNCLEWLCLTSCNIFSINIFVTLSDCNFSLFLLERFPFILLFTSRDTFYCVVCKLVGVTDIRPVNKYMSYEVD
jgi:hypothetical protein